TGCVSLTGTIYSSGRCAMLNSRVRRKLWLAGVAAGLLTLASCSNQATKQGEANTAPKKVAPPKEAEAETAKSVTESTKVTPATMLVTVPKGTSISATIGQTPASQKNHAGDSFAASLSTPVKVGGRSEERRVGKESRRGRAAET